MALVRGKHSCKHETPQTLTRELSLVTGLPEQPGEQRPTDTWTQLSIIYYAPIPQHPFPLPQRIFTSLLLYRLTTTETERTHYSVQTKVTSTPVTARCYQQCTASYLPRIPWPELAAYEWTCHSQGQECWLGDRTLKHTTWPRDKTPPGPDKSSTVTESDVPITTAMVSAADSRFHVYSHLATA
jgi:hypothetical protein